MLLKFNGLSLGVATTNLVAAFIVGILVAWLRGGKNYNKKVPVFL